MTFLLLQCCDIWSSYLLRSLESEVGSKGNCEQVLVCVDDRVHDTDDGWVLGCERDAGNVSYGRHELSEKDVLGDVEDLWAKDLAVVVDGDNLHPVGEWRDVQHVEQGSLGSTDLGSLGNDLDLRDNLDGTSGNLGWNTESLEERGLRWVHSGVSGLDEDIERGESTCTGWGSDGVVDNLLSDVLEVTVGEDETHVSSDQGDQSLELWDIANEASESSSDHGVLSEKDDGLTTERLSDQVHLLGSDVVDSDDEA